MGLIEQGDPCQKLVVDILIEGKQVEASVATWAGMFVGPWADMLVVTLGLGLIHAVHWLSIIVGHNDSSSSIIMRIVQLTHLKSLSDLFLFPPDYQANNNTQRYNPTYNISNNRSNINFTRSRVRIPRPKTPRKVVFRRVGIIIRVRKPTIQLSECISPIVVATARFSVFVRTAACAIRISW